MENSRNVPGIRRAPLAFVFFSPLFATQLSFDLQNFSYKSHFFHPRTGHECPEREREREREWRYSSTLSLTLALGWGGWSTSCPGHFTPGKKPGTHCTGGWLGPRAGLTGAEDVPPVGIRGWDCLKKA